MRKQYTHESGFTLIELSIVLVIIGLIVGGILVGQSLINAAAVRAQISQIEKFNTAVNTFYGKYGYLPGDIPDPYATQFGLTVTAFRGTLPGQGDGNGLLECYPQNGIALSGAMFCTETLVFWEDLSTAGLIDGTFNKVSELTSGARTSLYTPANLLPQAKINASDFVYVWSGDAYAYSGGGGTADNQNYFGVTAFPARASDFFNGTEGLTVQQAYSIDGKMDDGLPQSGRVLATLPYYGASSQKGSMVWAGLDGTDQNDPAPATYTSQTPQSSLSCFDNGNTAGAPQQYSLGTLANGGTNVNCALSFRFQ